MPTSSQKPNPLLTILTPEPSVEETPATTAPDRVLPPPEKPRFMQNVRNAKRGAPMLKALRPRRRG